MTGCLLLLLMTVLSWGGSWVSAEVLVGLVPPMTISFFRPPGVTLLFLSLVVPWFRTPRVSTDSVVRHSLLLGATGVFGSGVCFIVGLSSTTAAQGIIIAGVNAVVVSMFAHLFHGGRLARRWQYVGYVLSFAGVVFVIGLQSLIDFRPDHLFGDLLILCAMMMWGLYSSFGKSVMRSTSTH